MADVKFASTFGGKIDFFLTFCARRARATKEGKTANVLIKMLKSDPEMHIYGFNMSLTIKKSFIKL